MNGISFWFVLSATVYVTIGMAWGIQMSVIDNHLLSPAHAHLNLVGWVTMALFGIYYHLVPQAAGAVLAKIHFTVATLGVWAMVPGIIQTLKDNGETLVKVGSMLTLASMLIFLYTVFASRAKA
ncbi:MAG: hypothetical protein ACE5FS_16465, partial [Paracoccaceae bacterium]